MCDERDCGKSDIDIKYITEIVERWCGLFYKIGLLIGVFIVLTYCLSISYYPRGVSFGDVFVFIFALFSFSFVYSACLIVGGYSTYWIASLINFIKSRKNKSENMNDSLRANNKSKYGVLFNVFDVYLLNSFINIASILIFIRIVLLIVDLYERGGDDDSRKISMLLALLMSGFLICALMRARNAKHISDSINDDIKNKTLSPVYQNIALVIIIVLTPVLFGSPLLLVNAAMDKIGIRSESVPVLISDDNFKRVNGIASAVDYPIDGCALSGGIGRIVTNMDILWRGIGDTAYVLIKSTGRDGIRIELDGKGVMPINPVGNGKLNPTPSEKCPGIASSKP